MFHYITCVKLHYWRATVLQFSSKTPAWKFLALEDTRDHDTIGESTIVYLDHVCLDIQSHYSLNVTEFFSLFADSMKINEKFLKLNHTCLAIVHDFSHKTAFFHC